MKSIWLLEASIFSDFTDDLEKPELNFTISTSHFMIRFDDLPETVSIL